MVYVRRLKERKNVIEVFRVTYPHGFLVLEAPEPKCWCGQVIAQKYTLLCAIIVSGIGDVRMLPWQMTCHIGAKNMSVTFKPVGTSATPMKTRIRPKPAGHIRTPQKRAYLVLTNANGTFSSSIEGMCVCVPLR